MLMKSSGLTLIELMVVVAVMAVMAAVGIPLYNDQVQKSRRYDAQGVLMSLANQLEQHRAYQPNVGYSGFVLNDYSELWGPLNGSYLFSVTLYSTAAPFDYDLTAAPAGPQTGDRCGSLSMDELGGKSAGEANCWK